MLTTVRRGLQLRLVPDSLTLVDMSTLQARLEQAMKHAEVNKAALAKACGISTAAVAKWFGGDAKNLKMEHLFAVSDLCKVDPRWLDSTSSGASSNSGALTQPFRFGHGLNDAQKTMGVITVLLYSTGYLHGDFHVPHWVALGCYIAIGLGTLTGGWRIIETMGTRITKLNQHQGFSASAGGSVMLFAASYLGIPVSTTHTITGCVIGAGAARRASAVRWGVAGNVMIAWIITIPASASVAALFYYLTTFF